MGFIINGKKYNYNSITNTYSNNRKKYAFINNNFIRVKVINNKDGTFTVINNQNEFLWISALSPYDLKK